MAKILIVDADVNLCRLLDRFLKRKGHTTFCVGNGKKAISHLKQNSVDIVFCDYRLPDTDGKEMLLTIKELDPTIQVIITTAYSDVKVAVDVIKKGAFDYITKPLLPEEILLIVDKAIAGKSEMKDPELNNIKGSVAAGQTESHKKEAFSNQKNWVAGRSKQAKQLNNQLKLVAPTNYSVVITGENGVGKGWLAYGIHLFSARKDGPFIIVDCGYLAKEQAANELFGYKEGPFSDDKKDKKGQFELAHKGTIFLNEVQNLPLDVQVSLLRTVKEGKIRRVGAQKEMDIDVRIIIASSEKLSDLASKGLFREDLYHRFNQFSIEVPRLRERVEDIMVFADVFLKNANKELDKEIQGFVPEVERIFLEYSWPGNLLEMNNIIKRAALLTNKNMITLETLPQEIVFQSKFDLIEESRNGVIDHNEIPDLKAAALRAEYEKIFEVLRRVNFNKSKAAILLNIDRKTLYNKMKTFNALFSV